jgi:hypothetical protein
MSSSTSAFSVVLQGVLLGPDAHILEGMKSAEFSQHTKAFDKASPVLAWGKFPPDGKIPGASYTLHPLAFCRSSNRGGMGGRRYAQAEG